jgi:hypothetical protein
LQQGAVCGCDAAHGACGAAGEPAANSDCEVREQAFDEQCPDQNGRYCERLIGHDGSDANADEPTDQGGADSSQQHDGDVCAV